MCFLGFVAGGTFWLSLHVRLALLVVGGTDMDPHYKENSREGGHGVTHVVEDQEPTRTPLV